MGQLLSARWQRGGGQGEDFRVVNVEGVSGEGGEGSGEGIDKRGEGFAGGAALGGGVEIEEGGGGFV